MSNIVSSVGKLVEAGIQGLTDLADGYLHLGSAEKNEEYGEAAERHLTPATEPIASPASTPSVIPTVSSSPESRPAVLPASSKQSDLLIQVIDLPSGWIHLQPTYLGEKGGQKRVRSFGLMNMATEELAVEILSDLGKQLIFWTSDDDRR